jgi:hypothetical protein
LRRQNKSTVHRSREVASQDTEKRGASETEKVDWKKWLEHWETWNAIVADVKPPSCGLFGCDERIKVGDKWKCIACGKITDD